MSRLLTAKTEIVPLLVCALILFAVPLASCANGGDEGSQGSGDEGVTSYSANANPRDGDIVEEVASERADQNPGGALPSEESGSSDENPGGEARSSEAAGANPAAELPPIETPTASYVYCNDEGCYYFFDIDGDGIGAGDPVRYEPGTEPPGWVRFAPDNCPDVYNPGAGQYGTEQPDINGDGVGDACDPDTSGQYGGVTGQ